MVMLETFARSQMEYWPCNLIASSNCEEGTASEKTAQVNEPYDDSLDLIATVELVTVVEVSTMDGGVTIGLKLISRKRIPS